MRSATARPLAGFVLVLALAPVRLPAQEVPWLGNVIPLYGELVAVHDLVLAGRWTDARDLASTQLRLLVGDVETAPEPVAAALALQALAEVGSGKEVEGFCHWNMAKGLSRSLGNADLSRYGKPGVFLREHTVPSVSPEMIVFLGEAKETGEEVLPPEKVSTPDPQYTEQALDAKVEGKVVLEVIIDEKGRVTRGRIREDLPLGLGISALETICRWQFEPASLEGVPVRVYYNLTVNFMIAKEEGSTPP